MPTAPLSEDMALRIGLAARALPDTDPAALMAVLDGLIGLPPKEKKLQALGATQLRDALEDGAEMPATDIAEALAILKGEGDVALVGLPDVVPYRDGDMPGSIQVAVASNSAENLDGHFGSCTRFLIYRVSDTEHRLIEVRKAASAANGDEKNTARARQVGDCQILYVVSIGGPAAAKAVKAGVHPIKKPLGGSAPEILAELSNVLAGSPPPWLAKILGQAPEDRVRFERSDAA